MRNLIIATLVFSSAGSVLLYERNSLAYSRRESERLAVEAAALEQSIAHGQDRLRDLERRRAAQAQELMDARARLEQERAARRDVPPESLDPEVEGTWPAPRPYFYLAKKHIPSLGYAGLNWNGRVTAEAAALFGMTSSERRTIDASIEAIFMRLRARELNEAYRTNTPPMVEKQRKGEKISIFIPGNTKTAELVAEFAQSVGKALGPQRAALFLDKIKESQVHFDGMSEKDRIVTIVPRDESSGDIIITQGHGTSFNYYGRTSNDRMQFEYGHILAAFLPQ